MQTQQNDKADDAALARAAAGARDSSEADSLLLGAAAQHRPEVLGAGAVTALQRAAGNAATAALFEEPAALADPGAGSALDDGVRRDMEARLGADFSGVRVHTDSAAHEAATSVQALAYTSGNDIVFQHGQYDPDSDGGRTVLAHELTHVIQQRNGPVEGTDRGDGVSVSDPSDRFEREAVANAERVMSRSAPEVHTLEPTTGAASSATISRLAGDEAEEYSARAPSAPGSSASGGGAPRTTYPTPEGGQPGGPFAGPSAGPSTGPARGTPTTPTAPSVKPPVVTYGPAPAEDRPRRPSLAQPGGTSPTPDMPGPTDGLPTAGPARPGASAGGARPGGAGASGASAGAAAPAAPARGAAPAGAAAAPAAQPATPVPAAPAPAPAPAPGQAPDPETARSGISWNDVTLDNAIKYGRPALEAARIIPGWGLLAGAGSDLIGLSNDMKAIPSGDYPATTYLIAFRDIAALLNNAVGHVGYVAQLVQDCAAGSVVGAELLAVTTPINEVLSSVKVGVDSVLLYSDIGIMVGAQWNKTHADPAQAAAWQGVFDGAAANFIGDVVGTVLDVMSMSSAGAANTDAGRTALTASKEALTLGKALKTPIISWVQSAWNLWGSDGVTGARGLADDAGKAVTSFGPAYDAAATILESESVAGRAAWSVVDGGISKLEAAAAEQMADMNALCAELSGGRSLWQVIQDAGTTALTSMHEEIASLQDLESGVTNAQANEAEVKGWIGTTQAEVDALTIPEVHVPKSDLGDGVLANAAEALADVGGSAADVALQLALTEARQVLAESKATVRGLLQQLQGHADEIGEFMATAAQVTASQTAVVEGKIATFQAAFAQCNGFEDAINMLVGGFAEMAGAPRITVQDVRDLWADIPPYFDKVDAAAVRCRQKSASLAGDGGAAAPAPTTAPPAAAPANP